MDEVRTAHYYKRDGAVALFNDADTYCIDCAVERYGYRTHDNQGNCLYAVYEGSDDLHGQYCMGMCYQLLRAGKRTEEENRLCNVECTCYEPCNVPGYRTNYDFYNEYGRFPTDDDIKETPTYSVLVGNVGWCVQDEADEEKARQSYAEYVAISKGSQGIGHRGYNEHVSLWTSDSDDPLEEYEPYKPTVDIELRGENGNAFVIIEQVVEALQSDGRDNLAKDYMRRATSGDYEHLLEIISDYCTVEQWDDDDDDEWEDDNWYEEE